jgi:site-specific DNA recombinase
MASGFIMSVYLGSNRLPQSLFRKEFHPMSTLQAAIYARVSSDQQAEANTIASQVSALKERAEADGVSVSQAMTFLDEGYSGATLVRPALERLRDAMSASLIDRLYVHSPDRLARKYAYQVFLVEEFSRLGVEVVFLNRELGRSPEDDLLLQGQGMMAQYERAKIMERNRRGKLHAARSGSVNVLGGAPYGYRYVSKHQGGGQAYYEVVADEARVVRQVFDWVGRERLSMGEVCRRLMQAGERTHTGRTVWDRSVVWGMLKNPAYRGQAAFGKTQQGPLRPRLRAQRGRPLQPRQATSSYDVPSENGIPLPVPALVEPELFDAVQAQLEENRRHARQTRRGARYLLQGLLQCQHCGYAFYGKPLSPSTRKHRPRAYAYYRCLGTDAYRFGGERICPTTQVRTDRLELAVWHEICALLARPERLRQEFERRQQATGESRRQERSALEAQVSKLRQGVSRLIESYTEGLIDKDEFEPRVRRLRQRIAHIEEQCEALAGEETLERELHLIVSRLDDFAAQVGRNLDDLEWAKKREIIRDCSKDTGLDSSCPRLMQGLKGLLAPFALGFSPHVERNSGFDLILRADTVNALLHLPITPIATFHRIGGRGEPFVIEKGQGLLQGRRIEFLQRLAQMLEPAQALPQFGEFVERRLRPASSIEQCVDVLHEFT